MNPTSEAGRKPTGFRVLREIENRFWGAATVIMGKNRTVRLSGGTETGRTMSEKKVWLRFQKVEKSDIPVKGVSPLHHLGTGHYTS